MKTMNKKKRTSSAGTAIKYIVITIVGILLFSEMNQVANADRITDSVGGEGLFLFLPLLWWLLERTTKDLVSENKAMQQDAKHKAYKEGSK